MASEKDLEAGPPSYQQSVMSGAGDGTQQPPTYSATQSDPMAPPPSYESLYGKVKAAKQQSSGNVDFGKKFAIILCSTLGCTIMLAVILAIPISMIVIGAIYKDDCPAERMIPIYLIVGGSFGILKNLSSLGQRFKNRDDEDSDEKNAKTNPFDATLNCFLFAWFIAGNVWVYRTHGEWTSDSSQPNYCDPTLYWFSFWIITASYIFIGACCFCACLVGCCAACFGDK